MLEKKVLSLEEIEGQTAIELPDRELMALIYVKIDNNDVAVPISAVANVCPNVNLAALSAEVEQTGHATCNGHSIAKA